MSRLLMATSPHIAGPRFSFSCENCPLSLAPMAPQICGDQAHRGSEDSRNTGKLRRVEGIELQMIPAMSPPEIEILRFVKHIFLKPIMLCLRCTPQNEIFRLGVIQETFR